MLRIDVRKGCWEDVFGSCVGKWCWDVVLEEGVEIGDEKWCRKVMLEGGDGRWY